MLSNKNTTDFICSVCGDQFQNENQFYGHLQIHSGEVVWNCSQCDNPNISFGSQSRLIAHENLHHNLVRPFKCSECELVFERASQLDYHRRSIHLGEKSQVCHICGKAFFRKTDLKTHLNVHLGTNQLICELCGRKFNHVSNLIRHCRSHAGMKPYPCCICGKRFTQLSSLTRHKRIHGNDSDHMSTNDQSNPDGEKQKVIRRRHYCKTCGESFQFVFLLRQHEQMHIKEDSSFECKNCYQVFHAQEDLQDHQCKPEFATGKCDIEIMNDDESSIHGKTNKLPVLMIQESSQIEFDDNEVSPILQDLGQKLDVIEIETNRDESINISDILSPYNCDEIELPNNLTIQADRGNNVEEILSGVDFSLMSDSRPKRVINTDTLKDQRSKCLHIEGSQLYIEVCESDYLKTLGLHALEFGENGGDLFPETDNITESISSTLENCEPTLRLVQTDAGQQFYELEINSQQLGQDRNDMLNYNSHGPSLLDTPVSDEINQIELPIMNQHMNFIDEIATNMINPNSDSVGLKSHGEIPGFNQNEIQAPMVRLVQNEEGEQFFELVRDSSDYQQVCRSSDNTSSDNLLEEALESIVDISRANENEQQLAKEASSKIRKKPRATRAISKCQTRKFECIVCNKRFSTVSNLKQHTGTHFSDQQKFQCKECGMSFAWKSTLNKHMASTHRPDGPQKFVCEICPKVYSTLSQVNEHVKRDHLKERNHVCTECGKSFFKKFDLKSHIRTHTNERPYVCPACGKSFHHQSHIIRHERIHSGERPYSCNICNKSFTQPGSLKTHKQRHQDVEKVHILDYRIDEDDPIALSTL